MLNTIFDAIRDSNIICTVTYRDPTIRYSDMDPIKIKMNEKVCEITYKNRKIYCTRDAVIISLRTKEK